MKERDLLRNSCYAIPMREKISMFARRIVLIPYLILRYKMRRFIPTDMENSGDVVRKYIREYEAEKILRALGIKERDATAAVKASTYMHNLTHPLGGGGYGNDAGKEHAYREVLSVCQTLFPGHVQGFDQRARLPGPL